MKTIHVDPTAPRSGPVFTFYCSNCKIYIRMSKRNDFEREIKGDLIKLRLFADDYKWLVSVKKANGLKNLYEAFSYIRSKVDFRKKEE